MTKSTAIPSAAGTAPKPEFSGPNFETTIRTALRSNHMGLALVAAFSVAINMLMLTSSIYLMQISDRVLSSGSLDTLTMLTIGAVGAMLVLAVFDFLRRAILTQLGVRLETSLGGPVLAASLERQATGANADIQGLRDLGTVRGFLAGPVMPLFFDLPLAPAYIAVVYLIHPQLGHITLAGAAFLVVFALINQAWTKKPLATASQHQLISLARAQAQSRNAEVVRAMAMLPECVRIWGAENVRSLEAQHIAGNRNAIVSAISKFMRLVLQIGILGWGAYLVLAGDVSAGASIAASIIGARALQPIEGAIESWKSLVHTRESFERIKRLLGASTLAQPRVRLPQPKGDLIIERLAYAPAGSNDPILKGLSFQIPCGTSVALIGPTGAGKSTLAKLLVGALPSGMGAVRIDGSDLKNWNPEQLGEVLGYLPQDVELFPGTIAENIARLRADATSEKIVAAAQVAGVHDLVAHMKHGYETMIQLGGAPLSGGQRQRVALARAFYGSPKVIVLDEPDANLDRDGEEALLKAILAAKRAGITVIVTTQRASLLRFVDRIMMMRDGTIEAYGPREEVLRRLMGKPNERPKDGEQALPGSPTGSNAPAPFAAAAAGSSAA